MASATATIAALETLRPAGLLCFEDADGNRCIVDASGEVIAKIPHAKCYAPNSTAVLQRQWIIKIQAMTLAANAERSICIQDEWEKKFETWRSSLSSREMDKWRRRKSIGGRFFSSDKRRTWDDAIKLMQFQLGNRGARKLRHKKDPWLKWAETCSKNHNRKEKARAGKKLRDQGATRRAELQLRFVWSRIDPRDVQP